MTWLEMPGISVSFFRKPLTMAVASAIILRAIELVMIGGERNVGAILLQQMQDPMGEFDIAVARALGLPKRLQERLVADAVELAGDRFDADVRGHGTPRRWDSRLRAAPG